MFSFAEVIRPITPHTSYEELKLSQSSEMEETMTNQVEHFFMRWNNKLKDLQYRNIVLKEALEAKKVHDHKKHEHEYEESGDDVETLKMEDEASQKESGEMSDSGNYDDEKQLSVVSSEA